MCLLSLLAPYFQTSLIPPPPPPFFWLHSYSVCPPYLYPLFFSFTLSIHLSDPLASSVSTCPSYRPSQPRLFSAPVFSSQMPCLYLYLLLYAVLSSVCLGLCVRLSLYLLLYAVLSSVCLGLCVCLSLYLVLPASLSLCLSLYLLYSYTLSYTLSV